MANTIVDARGRSCPEPVIMTKRALDSHGKGIIEVLVDANVAKENVSRLARKSGCTVEVKESGDAYKVIITKE